MRLEIKFYGIENDGVISQDLIYMMSSTPIETVKEVFTKKIFNDIKGHLKDLENKQNKQKFDDEFIKKVKKFIYTQYKNFNIYLIKEVKELSSELEIIKVENDIKEKTLKEDKKYFDEYKTLFKGE